MVNLPEQALAIQVEGPEVVLAMRIVPIVETVEALNPLNGGRDGG